MIKIRLPAIFALVILILANLTLFFNPDPYTKNRLTLFSLSKGDRYIAHLNLWRLYIDNRRLDLAELQEKYLYQADLVAYKAKYLPDEFKKQLNNIAVKPDKTVEDYIEMAKIQRRLGKDTDVQSSLLSAKNLDPVRDDINALFFESQAK